MSMLKRMATAALLMFIGSAAAEEKTLSVNGQEIPYIAAGDGPLMVLLHGALSDYRRWSKHVELLSKDFQVAAIPLCRRCLAGVRKRTLLHDRGTRRCRLHPFTG